MDFYLDHLQKIVILGLVFIPLERMVPAWPRERYLRPQVITDVSFALLNVVFIALGLFAGVLLGMVAGEAVFPRVQGWVAGLPTAVQVIGGLLLADLCWYWTHRLAHRVPLLWRFHSVHHSIEHMDWLAAHRVHPIDQILTRGTGLFALGLVGIAPEAFGLIGLVYLWHGAIHHANIHLRGGWLRHVIVMSQFHHWHHANHPEAYDRNFAATFSFLDRIFGTWHESDREPDVLGVPEAIPVGYVDMLFHPFRRRVETAPSEAAK